MKFLPLSEAVSLMYTSPIFTAIFSKFLLNEPFGRNKLIFTIISLVGIQMIIKPNAVFGDD